MRSARLACLLLLFLASASSAQEDSTLPLWAPRWKVGDAWVVRTYLKDRRDDLASPKPTPGASPRSGPLPQLPDFPPLRDGVPIGYKKGNRWRFEVLRRESVRYDDDGPEDPPERFWVVSVRSLEGDPPRSAELWYAERDLVLSKIVLAPETRRQEVHWTRGTVQVSLPAAIPLGLPLDWPDLAAAARSPKARVRDAARREYEQRRKTLRPPKGEPLIRLALYPLRGDGRKAARPPVRFEWQAGRPFWTRLLARDLLAVLERPKRR